jgi:hypothetical protein
VSRVPSRSSTPVAHPSSTRMDATAVLVRTSPPLSGDRAAERLRECAHPTLHPPHETAGLVLRERVNEAERVDGAWRFADRLILSDLVGDLSRHLRM